MVARAGRCGSSRSRRRGPRVRAAKDRILLRNIAEDQPADNTMLALAVEDLKAADEAWRAHHDATGDRLVEPLLVVQVEPKVTEARLAEILATIESAWPELTDYAVAHAFGDPHGPLRWVTRPSATCRQRRSRRRPGPSGAVQVGAHDRLGLPARRGARVVPGQGLLHRDRPTDRPAGPHAAGQAGRRGDDRLNEVVAYLPASRPSTSSRVVKALTEDETVEVEV